MSIAKARVLTSFITIIAFAITYASCIKGEVPDPCKGVSCENNGVCAEGTCNCLYGYEGGHCDTVWYDKFRGTWLVIDSSAFQKDTFYTMIDGSKTGAANLIFNKFWIHKTDDIICSRSDTRTFDFKINQNVFPGYFDNYILKEGNGALDNSGQNIYGTYIINDPKKGDIVYTYRMKRN